MKQKLTFTLTLLVVLVINVSSFAQGPGTGPGFIINPPHVPCGAPTNTISVSACGSYTWPNTGQTYTQSGTYVGTVVNCVTQRLNLTINPIPAAPLEAGLTVLTINTVGSCPLLNQVQYTEFGMENGKKTFKGVLENGTKVGIAFVGDENDGGIWQIFAYFTDFQDRELWFHSQASIANLPLNETWFPTSECSGVITVSAPTYQQTVCAGATVANLSASGTNLKWFDMIEGEGGLPLSSSTPIVEGTYYVSQTVNGCESARTSVAVTVTNTPLPLTKPNQKFCGGTIAAQLQAVGNDLKWYDSNNSILSGFSIVNTGTYFVTQTVNGCESAKVSVSITINNTPAPTADALQSFSSAATVTDILVEGENLQWYDSEFGGEMLYPDTPLVDGTTYYVSQNVNNCESPRTAVTVSLRSCVAPTLSTVTAAPACIGGTTNIVLSGMLPNSAGVATYTVNNGFPQTASGTSDANGTFSFSSPVLNAQANNAMVQITKLTTASGCETIFTDKMVTLVVNALPTLGTVTIAPACAGSTTTVTLSGLLPNSTGTATYKLGPFAPVTVNGTSDANGNLTFVTPVLTAGANGLVASITNLTTNRGCSTNFTNKQVTVVVLAKPTLGTVTTSPVCAGSSAMINLNGLVPNSSGIVTYRVGNGLLQTAQGTASAAGTFSFLTPALSQSANGVVVTITKIETAAGCVTNFTGKTVALAVTNCGLSGKGVASKNNAELSANAVTLYPNPTRDILNIDSAIEIQSVVIFNMQGQQMLTATQKQINVSSLPAGTYMVRIEDTQNNVTTKRVIKN